MSTDRQRRATAANDAEKAKLQLARVIGLPIGQAFTMVRSIPSVPDWNDDARSGAGPGLSGARRLQSRALIEGRRKRCGARSGP